MRSWEVYNIGEFGMKEKKPAVGRLFVWLRGRELNPVCEIMSLTCNRTLPRGDGEIISHRESLTNWMKDDTI